MSALLMTMAAETDSFKEFPPIRIKELGRPEYFSIVFSDVIL